LTTAVFENTAFSFSMARSPVSSLGEILRKDGSVTMVGVQRPRSPKMVDKRFTFAGGKTEDWNTVSNAVTALFQRKKLAKLELSSLTEKVKSVKLEIGGPTICEWFKESLVKGMIILREDVKDKNGEVLLDKLADSWTYFFCTILPLLQAIFFDIQSREAQSTRSIALLNFRDVVVLKTKLEEAFVMDLTVPPKVVQMLLILQVRLRMFIFYIFSVARKISLYKAVLSYSLKNGLAILHFSLCCVTLIGQSDFQARFISCHHLNNKLTSFYHSLHTLDHRNVITRC